MALTAMTPEQKHAIAEEEFTKEQLLEMYPLDYYQPNTHSIPIHMDDSDTIIVYGGNRSSKTYSTCAELVGASMGKDANTLPLGKHKAGYQYRVGTKRKPLRIRVISKAIYIKENIQPTLELLFPRGSITMGRKNQAGHYESMTVKAPGWWDRQPFYAEWDFKTIDQGIDVLEAVAVDVVWNDEPMPFSFYSASITRIGADTINPVRMMFSMTPLEGANWMSMEFFEGEQIKQDIGYHVLSIWNNCKCLTPELHDRNPEPGRMYDNDGYCCCNRGHLHKNVIDKTLKRIRDPLEYEARVSGKPMFTYRSIFPDFKRSDKNGNPIHVIDPGAMGNGWVDKFRPARGTIYVVMDPHEARPDFIQFWVVDPYGMFYLIDEYPNYYYGKFKGQHYENIRHTPFTPIETARLIINTCNNRIKLPTAQCIIDPHFSEKTYNPRALDADKRTVIQVINEGIFSVDNDFPQFRIATVHRDSEGEIHGGLKALRELLYYDPDKPFVIGNLPHIQLSKYCENTIQSFLNHRREKPSDKDGALPYGKRYEERYKHGIDGARYFISSNPVHILEDRYDYDNVDEPPSTWAV